MMSGVSSEPLVKVDGGAGAKRAALIVAVLWMSLPEEPAKVTTAAPAEKKPAAKK